VYHRPAGAGWGPNQGQHGTLAFRKLESCGGCGAGTTKLEQVACISLLSATMHFTLSSAPTLSSSLKPALRSQYPHHDALRYNMAQTYHIMSYYLCSRKRPTTNENTVAMNIHNCYFRRLRSMQLDILKTKYKLDHFIVDDTNLPLSTHCRITSVHASVPLLMRTQ
jgi:hypothetical protein